MVPSMTYLPIGHPPRVTMHPAGPVYPSRIIPLTLSFSQASQAPPDPRFHHDASVTMHLPTKPPARAHHLLQVLLLLHFTGLSNAQEPCRMVITAAPGDTCVTIAEAANITVSQFLRSNPSITSCANLVLGDRYCVDPSFNPPAPPQPSPSLVVSPNGQCGGGLTCAGSPFGDCCSEHGWCGSSADHCGPQCQVGFGRCGSGEATTERGSTTQGSTTGGGVGSGTTVYVTSTVSQIVRQTVPVTVSTTVTTTAPGPATTSTVLVTQTSLVFISSTVTTIRTITITDAKMCSSRTAVAGRALATGVAEDVPGESCKYAIFA